MVAQGTAQHTVGPPPILVVDDDARGSSATESILVGGGYEVSAEARGDIVLQLVRASVLRLVISEIYIACSEGRCVVTVLKDDRSRLPRLRVLVYTRHASPSDLEWALAAGGDAVVGKPAASGILLREVQRLDGFASN